MIHKVKLIVRDEERWLTSVSYGYHIKFSDAPDIDKIIQLHQEVALQLGSEQVLPIEGGFLKLRFSSTDHDQFFYDWLFTSMMEEGGIEFLQNEVEAVSRISFWDCYCVGVEEWMSADGAPMGIELLLSPAILKKDALVHEKVWKITDIHGNTEEVKAREEEPKEEFKEEKPAKKCNGNFCITRDNYKEKNAEKLIQEINIRLAGFGGNVPTEEFDERTIATIKQFQRDYMEVPETGKICGSLLRAIDEFCDNKDYDFNFNQTKCPCGKCKGYGNGKTSGEVQLYKDGVLQPKATYRGTEYTGMHRSVLFGVRAFLFYLKKNIKLGYSLTAISSGYRCWESNAIKHRSSTNHMGKAIDLNFNKSTLADIENIRDKVLIPNLNAQIRWGSSNKFSLEPSRRLASKPKEFIATSWIHLDVREYNLNYLNNKFFVKSESDMKGQKIIDIAQNLELTDMCKCVVGSKRLPTIAQAQANEDICETCGKTKLECSKIFSKISETILQHEGGYSDRKEDRGGKTNKGISWNIWQAYAKVDLGVEPTVENLKTLTNEQAEIIYYKHYWQPKKFCKIKDIKVALMIYDWTITSGGASKKVQKLLVDEYKSNITVDGQIGDKTIEAINAIENQMELLKKIGKIRKEYYKSLTIDRATGKENDQIKNLQGWQKRVNDCLNKNIN